MLSPTQRFSDRVDNYVRYRPSYPREVGEMLRAECGLTLDSVVADIGSGTGKLTELLLPHAKRVVAVEPNLEMREAGERLAQTHSNFVGIAGTAEATTLAEHSVDLIVVGQAFHWFDRECTRTEFRRILKPGGLMLSLIDYQDHYSWLDSRISRYNFLRYPGWQWVWFNSSLHYQNRLRHSQYQRMFFDAGLTVVSEEPVQPSEHDLECFRSIRMSPEFQNLDAEDLTILGSRMVHQVEAQAASHHQRLAS